MLAGNAERELALQRLVTVYIITGLLFMLFPGTFLGVWNLVAISSRQTVGTLSPAWLQAHGHAQIFGWIGTFIIGIGFYSLSKMGRLPAFAVSRGWVCWSLWTCGLLMRWTTNVYQWHWRMLLPVSAALEATAFLTFFRTVAGHRPSSSTAKVETWMRIVIGSTFGFLLALLMNLVSTIYVSARGADPALPHVLDQRLLVLYTWGFLVPSIWGFNARWLPVFLGLEKTWDRGLLIAFGISSAGVMTGLFGYLPLSVALLTLSAGLAAFALHVFEPAQQPPKTLGVHPSFPLFVRVAYVWLLIAAALSMWAIRADQSGGIWGASRHAVTVGFISTMVFAIGQRILPAFSGMRVLFSGHLMFGSLALLNLGCALRVSSQIAAYEGYAQQAWSVLPVSGVVEMAAVTLFAANLILTVLQPPAHLQVRRAAA